VAEARLKAQAGGKLILYFVLVGDLDKEGC
jgi:hypothetical protein